MRITIIDYGAGNIQSVQNAVKEVANSSANITISSKVADLKSANYFILPGVGSFGDCMAGLKAIDGLLIELRTQLLNLKKPFLGICVGMQVLATIGYENGEHQGLGIINGKVEKISTDNLTIPHMGWNEVNVENNKHPLLRNFNGGDHFYFANSYHFSCQNKNNILASYSYGKSYPAVIAKENIAGIQFHPEKSGENGLKFLQNFLNWRP